MKSTHEKVGEVLAIIVMTIFFVMYCGIKMQEGGW